MYICVTDLHLLKFSDVGVTLQLQVSHLVLMFLMLMESLILLSLILLSGKLLEIKQKTPSGLNTSLIPLISTKLPDRGSDLFDLLSVLLWCSCASDPQALFKHRHTGLGFTALDLGQPSSFLCLPVLHLLYQPLVITLHLLHLLMTRRVGINTVKVWLQNISVFDSLNRLTVRSHLVMSFEELMSLHEVLILQLLLQQLVFLLQVALLQLPHGCLPSCGFVSQRKKEIE